MRLLKSKLKRLNLQVGSPIVHRIVGRKLTRIRDRILLRDEYTCKMCGHVAADLEVDHIMPLHLGGAESDANRQSLCCACHEAKSKQEEKERGF